MIFIVVIFIIDIGRLVDDNANAHPQKFKHLAIPASVALCEVIVDRHDVHALTFERVQIARQRRHQGFTLTSLHLSNIAIMQRHAADQLDVKRTHLEGSTRGFTRHCKSVWQNRIERLTLFLEALFQNLSLLLQICI